MLVNLISGFKSLGTNLLYRIQT